MRPGGGDADTPGWTSRVVPNLYPGAGRWRGRRGATPRSGEAGAFASAGDPLLESRRAGEPDLFASRPAIGAHEVLINAPEHVTAMAELSEERFLGAVATWRERMRAHADAAYVQLVVNEGGGRRGLAPPHPRPALRAAVRAGGGRARARAGRRLRRTHRGRRAAQRRPGRGGAAPRAAGRDRRRGGADLPLGLALALRAAGRAAPRGGALRGGHRRVRR